MTIATTNKEFRVKPRVIPKPCKAALIDFTSQQISCPLVGTLETFSRGQSTDLSLNTALSILVGVSLPQSHKLVSFEGPLNSGCRLQSMRSCWKGLQTEALRKSVTILFLYTSKHALPDPVATQTYMSEA